MSIKVSLDDLAAEITKRGPGYLLSAASNSRPHVMHLRFEVDGSELRAPIGRSAARNIEAQSDVTLLWPPMEDGDHSLIVDATASVKSDPESEKPHLLIAAAASAVLHRPA